MLELNGKELLSFVSILEENYNYRPAVLPSVGEACCDAQVIQLKN